MAFWKNDDSAFWKGSTSNVKIVPKTSLPKDSSREVLLSENARLKSLVIDQDLKLAVLKKELEMLLTFKKHLDSQLSGGLS